MRIPGTGGMTEDGTIGDHLRMVSPKAAGPGTTATGIMMDTHSNMRMAPGIDSRTSNGHFLLKKCQLTQNRQQEEKSVVLSIK